MNRTLSLSLAMMMISLGAMAQPNSASSPELASLIEAERAFARTCVEKGVRESFLAFFAEDGINFQPHPVRTREAILSRPAPAEPPPMTLNWEPTFADISASGDFGYTTGPYTITDRSPEHRPPGHGYYFSVWRKQADGSWKVAIDAGIQTPAPLSDTGQSRLVTGPTMQVQKPYPDRAAGEAQLMALDTIFLKDAELVGLPTAYYKRMAGRSRLHRNGFPPFTNRDLLRTFLEDSIATMTWQPMASSIAPSGEVGYTYGKYEQKGKGSDAVEKGYYVRVWRHSRTGDWKLMLDTTSPLPPGED